MRSRPTSRAAAPKPDAGRAALRNAALALALLCMFTLSGCLEGLFFHPDERVWSTPSRYGVAAEDVFIPGPDGARLHGWLLRAAGTPRGTVLHAHGNAANVSNHLPLVAWLPARGWNVLLFDYRGFGRSDGEPSLDGVVADTRAALRWLRGRPDIDASRIVLLGNSLGGATVLRVAASDAGAPPLRGLIVDSAFASYRGIARDAAGPLAWLGGALFASLPDDASDPVAAARRIALPLLVMHGSADRVIGIAHGEALFAAAPGPQKEWLRIDGGQHLEGLMRDDVRERVAAWLGALS